MGARPETGLLASVHLLLAELSHVATLAPRDAGKYSQAVCLGGGSEYGEHLVPVVLIPLDSQMGPVSWTRHSSFCQNNRKGFLRPWDVFFFFFF